MKCFLAAISFLTLFISGCESVPNPHSKDPLEHVNRTIFNFNEHVDKALIKPATKAYVKVIPSPVRRGVHNVLTNVDDGWSFINAMLQGKREAAGRNVGRVLINSFFGIGGAFDLASEAGVERQQEDFGQTLAVWGVPQGPYLVLPFLGPSTIRDAADRVPWLIINPLSQGSNELAYSSLVLRVLDGRSELLDSEPLLNDLSMDRYTFVRSAYWQHRAYEIRDGQPEPIEENQIPEENSSPDSSSLQEQTPPTKADPALSSPHADLKKPVVSEPSSPTPSSKPANTGSLPEPSQSTSSNPLPSPPVN